MYVFAIGMNERVEMKMTREFLNIYDLQKQLKKPHITIQKNTWWRMHTIMM